MIISTVVTSLQYIVASPATVALAREVAVNRDALLCFISWDHDNGQEIEMIDLRRDL